MANGTITGAVQRPGFVELTISGGEWGDEVPYMLFENDPYGDAPYWRAELARMVDAGELSIEPMTEEPEPLPKEPMP